MSAPTPPTLNFAASPVSVTAGQSSTLTWNSANVTGCTASGGWTGDKTTNGTQAVTPAATTTYTLSCTGTGGTVQRSATVTVAAYWIVVVIPFRTSRSPKDLCRS